MKILVLDQALQTTGYAVFENNNLIKYGSFTIKASLPIEQRLGEMWKQIEELYTEYDFKKVIFEDTQLQYGNVETFRKLCYVQSAIIMWCYFNDIKFKIYSPSSWRGLLGKGWGKKREEQKNFALKIIKDKYSINVNSDEADAICIGLAYINDKSSTESAF